MNARKFPRSPDIHNRPFADGQNPFTDGEPIVEAAGSDSNEGAYAAKVVDDHREKKIGDYEASYPSRARWLIICGIIGASLSGLSVLFAVMAIYSTDWVKALLFISPLSLMSIVFSIPAWLLAHVDLRAIRAGAMVPEARRGTRIAYWSGCLGTLLSLAPTIGGIVAVFITIFE